MSSQPELRAILDAKGRDDGAPVATNANAIPVRRVLGLVEALSAKPLSSLRLLDLACQEGCYALEFALAGAQTLGIDAREFHIQRARLCADQCGVTDQARFEIGDVRRVTAALHGRFDVVLLLGILYHLDAADAADTLASLYEVADDMLVIDTHVALSPKASFTWRGHAYDGAYVREHEDHDTEARRKARLQASIDNTFAFYFTKSALTRLLHDCGFPVVLEALAPLDATKPADRATFVALKRPVRQGQLFPWINGLSEDEIAETARPYLPAPPKSGRAQAAKWANALLHRLGFHLSPL